MGGRRDTDMPLREKRALYQRAACMCEFSGCAEPLFFDLISGETVNNAQLAHIIPSSANGPRCSEDDGAYNVDDPENRILLCRKHHELVDADETFYNCVLLRDMKRAHETKVAGLMKAMKADAAYPLIYTSKIKGESSPFVSDAQVNQAAVSNGHPLLQATPERITVDSEIEYATDQYWEKQSEKLVHRVEAFLEDVRSKGQNLRLAIFPIGPIPLIAKLGSLLTNTLQLDVFPKLRNPESWCWQDAGETNIFKSEWLKKDGGTMGHVALIMSISDNIGSRVLEEVSFDGVPVCHILAQRAALDPIRTKADLKGFDDNLYEVIGAIQNEYGSDIEIDVYPAISNVAAFSVGYKHMPHVHPKLNIYENLGKTWRYALSIGG